MNCRHCQKATVSRPRGLCWCCYYQPGVKDRYPSNSKYGRRGEGSTSGRGGDAAAPTAALPGSPEKIAVLVSRARAKQSLWHPSDAFLNREGERVGERRLMAG